MPEVHADELDQATKFFREQIGIARDYVMYLKTVPRNKWTSWEKALVKVVEEGLTPRVNK